ncbi:MAG TPA: 3-oxoacyl-[acyl-carrier-protein] reductase [Acidobacteriota bacterium]|nr:3-oxoacyl-[acyl-carrier-protein] reductase [Acidobacteriota bacterium]
MYDFSSRVALVTGSARGIGRRIAEVFAERGAKLVIADLFEEQVQSTVDELRKNGRDAIGVTVDVTDVEAVRGAVRKVIEEQGRIDILVNNAGITRDNLLLRMKDEEWRRVLATNLDGAFLMTREVLPAMVKERYGRIINIASVVGEMGNPGQANYAASKAGLIGFTKALAREVASCNITVNAIAPGYIETEMTAKLGEKARQELQNMIPMKRIGNVDDVAFGVCFLASKDAGYITGHVLNINGGMYM